MFTPKCAYDETYRKYTPGLVLIGDDKVRGFSVFARNWRRKKQVIQHNAMVGGVSFIQAVELLAPAF